MAALFVLLTLTPFSADRVEIYQENGERIVHLIGNVIIEGEKTTITCTEAKISEKHGWVNLIHDVELQGRSGLVRADRAIYYFNEGRGYLSDSVLIITPDERISSDSLYYDGVQDSVEMYGNVLIEDEENSLRVSGTQGWYHLSRDEGLLLGNPKLQIVRQDKEPITVYARVFKLRTNEDQFYGFDSVQAIIDSIVVYCDTFSYNLKEETGEMTNPVIQEKRNELRGNHGRFSMKNREIQTVSVTNGEAVYYTEEGSKNIVEGKIISILFEAGVATTIKVEGQPKGLLFLKRSAESAGD
jgi:lipopolysaccharide assembly outer membrane protein LptD (OstA)